jgi:hypothetical protein
VGPDVYDLLPEAPPAELDALRPLSWQAAFPHVFRLGGFHAVVGNPPYVRQELLGPHNKDYFRASYQVYHGVADLYSYFFELGARILLPGGLFGIIVANKWMRANYGEPLRRFLGGLHVVQVIDFGDLPVFATATTYPCVVVYENAPAPPTPVRAATPTRLHFPAGLAQWVVHNQFEVARAQLQPSGWALQTNAHHALLHKLRSAGTPLGEYVGGKIYYGIKTGLNEAFVVDAPTRAHLLAQDPRSSEVLRPFLAGRDVKRYQTPNPTKWLILLPKGWTRALFESTSLPHISLTEELAFQLLESNYPAIAGWLAPFRERGIKRTDKGEFWWELRACDYYPEFEKPKIIYPNISKGPIFTLDENQVYTNQKCFIITQFHFGLLGFLNSKLSYFLYENFLPKLRGGFHEPSSLYFLKFPVPNNLASLDQPVTTLLQLHRDLAAAALPHDQELIRHRIAHLDHQLDQLVYGLYGLTPAEIALIEASLAP